MDRPILLSAMRDYLESFHPTMAYADVVKTCESFATTFIGDRMPTENQLFAFVKAAPVLQRAEITADQAANYLISQLESTGHPTGIELAKKKMEVARMCAAATTEQLQEMVPANVRLPAVQGRRKLASEGLDLSDATLVEQLKASWGKKNWNAFDAVERRQRVDALRDQLTKNDVISVADEAKLRGKKLADLGPNERLRAHYEAQKGN